MKKILLAFCIANLAGPAYADVIKPVTFDLAMSSLKWTGKKVTGSHHGELRIKSASGKVSPDNSVSGSFEIDMTSLKVSDVESPKDNKKLVGHLMSPDFFDAAAFPVVGFRITHSIPIEGAKPGQANLTITGDLTIKGITHPVSFPAQLEIIGRQLVAKGTAAVDRTKFGVRYGSGKFFQGLGDKLIYDEFTVDLALSGTLG